MRLIERPVTLKRVTVASSSTSERCESCGAPLGGGRRDRRFCSAACRQRDYGRRQRKARETPALTVLPGSQDEASALEQLLDVERLVSVLARHAYGGHATSWRSAPFCCALRYR
jgi:endogenous inhibitor of DNA gyrase (YacG/DUF329 family)